MDFDEVVPDIVLNIKQPIGRRASKPNIVYIELVQQKFRDKIVDNNVFDTNFGRNQWNNKGQLHKNVNNIAENNDNNFDNNIETLEQQGRAKKLHQQIKTLH